MTEMKPLTPSREYKSRLFVMLFNDRERLLELYNAVSGRDYRDSGSLTINTLENAIYLSMKNDISFLIDFRLSLYEHQSTYNPNMPLRFLFYLADLYSAMTQGKNRCILRSPADSDAFQSGRYAEHNGRSKTLDFIV